MGALSVIFIAAGAVMTFAVADRVDGVDLSVVGIILMAVGVVGLFASLMRGSGRTHVRTERTVSDDGRTVVEDRETSHI